MTQDALLEMKIKVYDLKSYIEKETNKEYSTFLQDKIAILLNSDGSGAIADYEAVGEKFKKIEDKVGFEIEKYLHEKNRIQIFPSGYIKVSVKELLEKCEYEEMLGKEFFTKYKYNPRCSSNFQKLLNELD